MIFYLYKPYLFGSKIYTFCIIQIFFHYLFGSKIVYLYYLFGSKTLLNPEYLHSLKSPINPKKDYFFL